MTAPVSYSKEVQDRTALIASPVWKSRFVLPALALILGVLSYGLLAAGPLNSCQIARETLVGAFVEPYSGTESDPNLLEPVALALAQKRITRYVDGKSSFECAVILCRLWISPEEIKTRMRGAIQ